VLIGALLVNRRKRRRAEQSLRESEGRFRVLANAAPVMIRMSDAEGQAGDFNVGWLEFTGRALGDELGTGWMNAIHPDDLPACRETRRQGLEARRPFRMEYRLRRADGDYRWVLDSVQPRFTRDGEFVGLIASAIDITELKAARSALSNLNQRLMRAQEQERSRVARELHDDVCQQIAVFTLDLEHLREQIPGTDADTRRRASELCEGVRTLGDEVRAISHRLHSSKLEFLGLPAAAGSLCREIASSHHLAVDYEHENVPAKLADAIAISVFRVLQEALSNVVKHAGATECRVSLRANDDELRLEVSDNGRGFDIQSAVAHAGLGLVSMQERLRLVNGRIAIDSRPGAGTTLRASVPLRQDPAGQPADPLRALSTTE
jgi:PAS domain S-box-containing protein